MQGKLNGGSPHAHFLQKGRYNAIFLGRQSGQKVPNFDFLLPIALGHFSHLRDCGNSKLGKLFRIDVHEIGLAGCVPNRTS